MKKNRGVIQSGNFYADHIYACRKKDKKAIEDFFISAPKGQGLSAYLKDNSVIDENERNMRTYLVRLTETDECIGYFSLKAGLISVNENEIEIFDYETGRKKMKKAFDTLPGVELANFALNSDVIDKYPFFKGIGNVLFTELIVPLINRAAKHIGIKVVYLFSLPYTKLMARYESYGFKRLSVPKEVMLHRRLKPRYDKSCNFMYMILDSKKNGIKKRS